MSESQTDLIFNLIFANINLPRVRKRIRMEKFGLQLLLIKVFVTVKTCSSFLNYVGSTSLDIALEVSSSERRRVVLLMESVQISPCGFICERKES